MGPHSPAPKGSRASHAPVWVPFSGSATPHPWVSPGYPTAYLEDGDPSVANVVEVDGAIVRVEFPRAAYVVVLVPVDAGIAAGTPILGLWLPIGLPAECALHAKLAAAGDVGALLHAVVAA